MAVMRANTSLAGLLPQPKYTGEHEELPAHARQKGPRIVGANDIDAQQLVLKVLLPSPIYKVYWYADIYQKSGPPAYRQRQGWRPRTADDFGDGGAFPEIPVAQYPLDMGRKQTGSSNALALQVDAESKVKYDAIARQGHREDRIIHTSFKDLIPLRQRADAGDITLDRPSEEEVQATKEKTKAALAMLVAGASAAQKPKTVKGLTRKDPTFVRYTPADQMGDRSKKQDRIMKIVERQQDPMEPPKHKHKKIPRGPPSPPPPVMHSPPRKLTAEDQEAWRIPPTVSNWKNPMGFTVPLDKRLAADGRGLQDVSINNKFASFTEGLEAAERATREEVKMRALAQQRLAEKEKLQKEDNLRALAQKARDERAVAASGRRPSSARSRSGSASSYSSRSDDSRSHSRDADADRRDRERQRAEQRRETQREYRQKNMGHERRIQAMARDQGRDISEKVALGLAKPTQSKESMYDSRLFNQSSGFAAGFNEDQAYDKPLFVDREALNSIYRSNVADEDDGPDTGETLDAIQKAKRFEALGRAPKEGFHGASTAEERQGPVQFVKDDKSKDPFGLEQMVAQTASGSGADGSTLPRGKRYGLDLPDKEDGGAKRARMEDDSVR